MDAAYNSLKKTVLFVVATALLLAAPRYAAAQAQIVVNPSLSNGTIQISNSTCNDLQILNLTSTAGAIQIQISITYSAADAAANLNWLYAAVGNSSTSPRGVGNNTITVTIPDSSTPEGQVGINLVIGLNSQFASSTATDSATVNLNVSDLSGATSLPIIVDYANNSSCGGNTGVLGNNYISITPGTLTMSAVQGGSQTLQLEIQNLTGSALTFYATTPASSTWLSTNATASTSLAPGGTAYMNVTAAAGTMSAGTISSQVTVTSSQGNPLNVTVSFTVGSSTGTGSGTLLLDGGTVTSRSFSYIASGPSATAIPNSSCITITESNANVTAYTDSFTTTGGNWLNVNGSSLSPETNQSFGGGCLLVQPNNTVNTLASGVYTAIITVSDSTGSTATATITLYISSGSAQGVTVSPGLLFAFPSVLTGATATESQQFTVTGTSPITLGTATAQSSPSWFSMSSPLGAGTGTETFQVTASPIGLPAGTYYTTIVLSSSTAVNTTIVVSLTVSQSSGGSTGGTTTSVVVPTSLNFASETGNYAWTGAGEAQTVTITGAYGGVWSTSVTYGTAGANWLRFDGPTGAGSGVFGSGPAALLVDIQPSNLAASSTPYTAVIAVTTPSGTTNVNVSLLITAAGNHVLLASPASALFTYSGSTPSPVQVVFSDSSQGFPGTQGQSTPAISVATQTSWLIATSVANTMTLSVNPASLATGAYAGSVTVTAAYSNSPLTYPVVLVVNGGTTTGPLTLSTSGLTFNAVAGGSLPVAQTLTVTASSSTSASVSVTEQTCTNYTWLTISPSGAFTASTSNSAFSVYANQSGIPAGSTCGATITFTSGSTTQTVSVSMQVAASGTGGNVTATPAGPLNFSYTQGGANPATQTVAIANATSGTSAISFMVTSSASWLTTNAGSSSVITPFSLVVTANPSGLQASSTAYTATLTISPNGGTPVTVNVTFAIAGVPVISATPTTMPFTYLVGSNNPPTQTVAVSGGGAAATFMVSTSSSGWLSVSPACTAAAPCTTPNTGTYNLTVTANPTGLNAGTTYNGSITIAGTGTATGSTIVNVTFAVSAPLPTITKVTNAASSATGPVSPGELISIFANTSNPIGPTPAVQLSSANCPSPCTNVSTTMGGVQVEFLPQGVFAPLLYVSATQINAVVPYEVQIAQSAGATVSVEVKYLGQASNAFVLQTATTAPGIFTANGSGSGLGAILQYDASGNYQGQNLASNPASPGWVLVMYVTGEGSIPSAVTGAVTSSTTVKPLVGAPSVLIDDTPATVQYYGEAYGIVSGVMQINVLVPTGIRTGQAVSLFYTIGGNTSQSGVSVQIK